MGETAMTSDHVNPEKYRLLAVMDGWFAAIDNLHEMPQEKRRSEARARALHARARGESAELSVRPHRDRLDLSLFKELREWVQLGERIGLFPRGATTHLDDHFLLDQFVNRFDAGLRKDTDDYSRQLRDPDYFTRAYSRAVAGLTAPELGRIHLTHFASQDEWHLALAEIQVLRATATVYPHEVAAGNTLNQYGLYWFIHPFESVKGEPTPSSWRDGSSWPGVKTSIRLDVLRSELDAFEAEWQSALATSLSEDDPWERPAALEKRRFKHAWLPEFSDEQLLRIGRKNGFDLKLMREQIVRLLQGRGRVRI